MKKIINRPYFFFFGLIPLTIIILLFYGETEYIINIYASYFVVELKSICLFSIIFFGLIGINYFSLIWLDKKLKKGLTIAHVVLQILSLVIFGFYTYQTNNSDTLFDSNFLHLLFFISFLIFLSATFIHLINFFLSLLSKKNN